ncbi:MAG: hypothetical protein HY688_04050 [Chloroflexi bacterium]|nr:hypothetical protein [Chloroflexota bacterium]
MNTEELWEEVRRKNDEYLADRKAWLDSIGKTAVFGPILPPALLFDEGCVHAVRKAEVRMENSRRAADEAYLHAKAAQGELQRTS